MESHLSKTIFFVFFCLAQTCYGAILFSSLPQTLVVSASPKEGQVLKAGEDTITMTWGLNHSYERGIDDKSYKTTKVKLCYAPESQADRGWRKTVDNLNKDKTCQFSIVETSYSRNLQSFEWVIERDVPTALYFVRVYAYDSAGNEVAYGQTIDNVFKIQAMSGRHLSLDIAAVCFSGFALVSVFGFYFAEKRSKRLQPKIKLIMEQSSN